MLWKFILILFLSNVTTNDFYLINNAMMTILTACYSEEITTVLWDSPDSNLVKILYEVPIISVMLCNNAISSSNLTVVENKKNFFIISIESEIKFLKILSTLKSTPWWNIMSTFFILNRTNFACKNARSILKIAWSMNIPTSIFICHEVGDIFLFTFNPYTNWAMEPWKKVEEEEAAEQEERWTLFTRFYYNNDSICQNLQFDQAKFLNGYQIQASLAIFTINSTFISMGYHTQDPDPKENWHTNVPEALKKELNVTLKITCYDYDFQNPYYVYHGLEEGLYDITIGSVPMHSIDNFPGMYPLEILDLAIIIQKRGYYTPLEKIVNYYGNFMVIALIIILGITYFVIYMSQRNRSLSFAGFEVLRLLVNTSVHSDINRSYLRIFFFVIFVYFTIMQSTLSGNLSAFLTKKELRKTPETLKDLEASYIKNIYLSTLLSFDLINPELRNKLIRTDDLDCAAVILNNPSAACISDKLDLIELAVVDNNLHVSDTPFAADYFAFSSRRDWPLKERVDMAIIRFLDYGFSGLWTKQYSAENEEIIRRAAARAVINYRPVTLVDINFAFVILAIGLVISSLTFGAEKFIARKKRT